MRAFFYVLLLLGGCATVQGPAPVTQEKKTVQVQEKKASPALKLKLRPIKSKKRKGSELGTIITRIYDSENLLIKEVSHPFGDCVKCARGISMSKRLGVRVEGKDLDHLDVTHKAGRGIKILNCEQRKFYNGYSCKFKLHKDLYTLKLTII